MIRTVFIFVFAIYSSISLASVLILAGGGEIPKDAMGVLEDAANLRNINGIGHILYIGWGSDNDSRDRVTWQAHPRFNRALVAEAPSLLEIQKDKTEFEKLLRETDAVFFTGGKQKKLLATVEELELKVPFSKMFLEKGIGFGGTSAGAAILSTLVITGLNKNGTEIDLKKMSANDLELLPGFSFTASKIIVDQHFHARGRNLRLLRALEMSPGYLGIGIDESCALSLTDGGRYGTYHCDSEGQLIWRKASEKYFRVQILRGGDPIDLLDPDFQELLAF